jgi:hypothetical protein
VVFAAPQKAIELQLGLVYHALLRKGAEMETTMAICAVYDDQLIEFLTSLGILRDLEAGKLRCRSCGDVVTLDSFYAVIPDSGQIRVLDSRPECVKSLAATLPKAK